MKKKFFLPFIVSISITFFASNAFAAVPGLVTFDPTQMVNAVAQIFEVAKTVSNGIQQIKHLKQQAEYAAKNITSLGDLGLSTFSPDNPLDLIDEADNIYSNTLDRVNSVKSSVDDFKDSVKKFEDFYKIKEDGSENITDKLEQWANDTQESLKRAVAVQAAALDVAKKRKGDMKKMTDKIDSVKGQLQALQLLSNMMANLDNQMRDLTVLVSEDSQAKTKFMSEIHAKAEMTNKQKPKYGKVKDFMKLYFKKN